MLSKIDKFNLFKLGLSFALLGLTLGSKAEVFSLTTAIPAVQIEGGEHRVNLLIKEAFKQLTIEAKIKHTPNLRTLNETNLGNVDGTYPHIKRLSLGYINLRRVSEPLGILQLVAITNNPQVKLPNGIADLAKYKVGYIGGWLMTKPIVKDIKYSFSVANEQTLFAMLKPQRFDIILYSKARALHYIKSDPSGSMRILDPIILTTPLYLFMHKKHQRLLPLISQQLKKAKNGKTFTL